MMKNLTQQRHNRLRVLLPIAALLCLLTLPVLSQQSLDEDRKILLKKHQDILTAFLTADAELLYAHVAERYFSAAAGAITWRNRSIDIEVYRELFIKKNI